MFRNARIIAKFCLFTARLKRFSEDYRLPHYKLNFLFEFVGRKPNEKLSKLSTLPLCGVLRWYGTL